MRLYVPVPQLPKALAANMERLSSPCQSSRRTISSIPNWLKKSRKSFTLEPFECWVIKNFLFSLFSVEGEELWAFSPRNHISGVGAKAKRMENSGYKYTHLKIPSNSFDETKIYSFWKIILHWVRSVPAVCTRSKGRDVNGMAAKLVRNFIFCRKTLSAEL